MRANLRKWQWQLTVAIIIAAVSSFLVGWELSGDIRTTTIALVSVGSVGVFAATAAFAFLMFFLNHLVAEQRDIYTKYLGAVGALNEVVEDAKYDFPNKVLFENYLNFVNGKEVSDLPYDNRAQEFERLAPYLDLAAAGAYPNKVLYHMAINRVKVVDSSLQRFEKLAEEKTYLTAYIQTVLKSIALVVCALSLVAALQYIPAFFALSALTPFPAFLATFAGFVLLELALNVIDRARLVS